jgi:hypothetical protein
MNVNIFHILRLKSEEHHNDLMVEWMCDPAQTHGLSLFAVMVVRTLWQSEFDEKVIRVKRECALSPQCVPDVVVQFEQSLLVIENKVNAGACRQGQIATQHELAREQQQGKPLYHVLLCPDRLPVDAFVIVSDSFRVLRYSQLAGIIETVLPQVTDEDARALMRQYAQYVNSTYGLHRASRIRTASASEIARRSLRKEVWSSEEFLKEVEAEGGADLRRAQAELIDVLQTMDGVEPIFEGQGTKLPTYSVRFTSSPVDVLRIGAKGHVMVLLDRLRGAGRPDVAQHLTEGLGALLAPEGKRAPNAPCLVERLGGFDVDALASALQSAADRWTAGIPTDEAAS